MKYEIRMDRMQSRPLAVVRRLAAPQALSQVVPEAIGVVWNVIRSQKLTGAGCNLAVYLDDRISVEAGVELESEFTGLGNVVPSLTPAGWVVTSSHFGPYGQLGLAHDAIHRWCRENNRVLAGPRWEVYGHWKDEWNCDPSAVLTDVYYLLGDPGAAAD